MKRVYLLSNMYTLSLSWSLFTTHCWYILPLLAFNGRMLPNRSIIIELILSSLKFKVRGANSVYGKIGTRHNVWMKNGVRRQRDSFSFSFRKKCVFNWPNWKCFALWECAFCECDAFHIKWISNLLFIQNFTFVDRGFFPLDVFRSTSFQRNYFLRMNECIAHDRFSIWK